MFQKIIKFIFFQSIIFESEVNFLNVDIELFSAVFIYSGVHLHITLGKYNNKQNLLFF